MATLSHALAGSSQDMLYQFTSGLEHDAHLAEDEILVQLAWCDELYRCGLLSAQEREMAQTCLLEARDLMRAGHFPWLVEDEDIHMNLERFITEKAGSLGKKLHQGRSRNDLIATTLRLYVARHAKNCRSDLGKLSSILTQQANDHVETFVPGQTHLQFGQPLSLAHVLLSYVQAFERSARVFESVEREALYALPLGAAALAGSSLPVCGERLAKILGFERPCLNSYDAVGDRDFALIHLDALSLMMTTLARQCADIIVWASTPFGLVRLPKDWSTGSSIMPNKRNPDVPELVRARAARAIGRAAGAKSVAHALGTSYASDLHELKKDLVDACLDSTECLGVLKPFFRELVFCPEVASLLLGKGHVLATEVADVLCGHGLPFRDAYKTTGELVTLASSLGVQVHELSEVHLTERGLGWLGASLRDLTVRDALAKRDSQGGTSLRRVKEVLGQGEAGLQRTR